MIQYTQTQIKEWKNANDPQNFLCLFPGGLIPSPDPIGAFEDELNDYIWMATEVMNLVRRRIYLNSWRVLHIDRNEII